MKRAIWISICLLFVLGCGKQLLGRSPGTATDDAALEEARLIMRHGHHDALLQSETEATQQTISLEGQNRVSHFVSQFMNVRRPFMKQALSRRRSYEQMVTKVLRDYGLPKELSSVALVESGYDPEARSSHGALGMWQFMKKTAKAYGLRVGMFVDERKHVLKSTEAAARYLSYLFNEFGDWHLALAAYNGGPGRVRRAVKKLDSRDFFYLAQSSEFSQETKDFVPKVLAAAIISQDPNRYGFKTF